MSGFTVSTRSVRRKSVSCSTAGSVSCPCSSGFHHVFLPIIESHRVAVVDPSSSLRLSELSSSSVGLMARMSYMSGVRSLHGCCTSCNLSSCPVDAITLRSRFDGMASPLVLLLPGLAFPIVDVVRYCLADYCLCVSICCRPPRRLVLCLP